MHTDFFRSRTRASGFCAKNSCGEFLSSCRIHAKDFANSCNKDRKLMQIAMQMLLLVSAFFYCLFTAHRMPIQRIFISGLQLYTEFQYGSNSCLCDFKTAYGCVDALQLEDSSSERFCVAHRRLVGIRPVICPTNHGKLFISALWKSQDTRLVTICLRSAQLVIKGKGLCRSFGCWSSAVDFSKFRLPIFRMLTACARSTQFPREPCRGQCFKKISKKGDTLDKGSMTRT